MSELTLAHRLRDWAMNEEMVDQWFTEHGKDCMLAADELERLELHLDDYRYGDPYDS